MLVEQNRGGFCLLCSDQDPCLVNPCHNNGTCVNMETSYECRCPDGFEGRYCETGKSRGPQEHLIIRVF